MKGLRLSTLTVLLSVIFTVSFSVVFEKLLKGNLIVLSNKKNLRE